MNEFENYKYEDEQEYGRKTEMRINVMESEYSFDNSRMNYTDQGQGIKQIMFRPQETINDSQSILKDDNEEYMDLSEYR